MKILFSDFDGTLVDQGKLKNKSDIKAIEAFRKKGNLFVICSGRNIQEISRDLPKLNIPFDYLILNNGSQIVDCYFNTIYNKTINKDVGIEILDYLMTYKDMWVYYSNANESYGTLNSKCMDQSTGKIVEINFVEKYKASDHFTILCFVQSNNKTDVVLPIIDTLKLKYSNDVEVYLNTCFVDICAKGCSKGNSIHVLKEILNIDAVTYAIGDSYNDLPMIQMADSGYTFKNVDISKEVNNQVDSIKELIKKIEGE